MNRWGIFPLIVGASTDSAAVMPKTIEAVSNKVMRVPCITHALHNCVKTALREARPLEELVDKCHALAVFFHSSPKMAQALHDEQTQGLAGPRPLSVILDVATRWNSTYHMLERLLLLRSHIESVSMDLDAKALEKLQAVLPSSMEWAQIKYLVKMLASFESLTRLFSTSSQHGLAAMIAPHRRGLLDDLDASLPEEADLPDTMWDSIDSFHTALVNQVRQRMVVNEDMAMATVLHPTFNDLFPIKNREFRESVMLRLRYEFNNIAPTARERADRQPAVVESDSDDSASGYHRMIKYRKIERQNSFGSEADDQVDELTRYLQINVVEDVDPLEWWWLNQNKFPTVAKLARKYLTLPASSVASERMFSLAGNIVNDNRTRLADDAIKDLVFCHYAKRCLVRLEE